MRGDHRAGIAYFRNALSDEPYDRVSLSELGKSLLLAGDKSAAQGYLDRARRLDDVYNLINRVRQAGQENQANDLTHIGSACEAAGLFDEARGWYLLAIGRDPLDALRNRASCDFAMPPVRSGMALQTPVVPWHQLSRAIRTRKPATAGSDSRAR